MPENKIIPRIEGLDTLRACAIVLVLAYHFEVVVSGTPTFGILSETGWMGVDLFFVLSGYLIGNQIMSAIAQGKGFSLPVFFARRLLRTLPNYYFILAIYLFFPGVLGGTSTASIWQFLSFTQNLGLHYGVTFTHSWSLCIEEQFYLVLPVVALLVARFLKSVRLGWTMIGLAIIAGMVARGAAWLDFGGNSITASDFSTHIYYSTFARFDELLPGVAIAMLKNFHAGSYTKILRRGNSLLFGGLLAFVCASYLFLHYLEINGYSYPFFVTTFGYPMLAMSFALLTLSALSPNSLLNRVRVPGAARLALWSYAIYLAHKPIFKVVMTQLQGMNVDANSPAGTALILIAGVVGGWALHVLIETPFMQLRERLFPKFRVDTGTNLRIADRAGSQVRGV